MVLDINSKAAANGVSVKNTQFQPGAEVLKRKILAIGTYDPAILTIIDEEPIQVFSPEDCGAKTGFGFMLHRLAVQAFLGSGGVEFWIQPQAEEGGSAQSAGEIDFATSTGVLAGTFKFYVAGIVVSVVITAAMTADEIAAAVVAAITANKLLPVTATALLTVVTITSKSTGPWGDDITLRVNIKTGDKTPTGIVYAITDMAGGSGLPTMADALNGLGTGDDANEQHFTDVVHGYGQDTTTLDSIETYVGAGNTPVGLYGKLVARPFRVLTGDTVKETAGLTALIALGNGRKYDRANGVVAVPDSANHPAEIAAQLIGHMARINNNRAQDNYKNVMLSDIDPGAKANRWTSSYDNRDLAVNAGVTPTKIKSGAVFMGKVLSFYHPDEVSANSNGYASMRNISITQNMLAAEVAFFDNERFDQISIVADVAAVTGIDKLKAMDVETVKDLLIPLINSFAKKAWIYEAAFTIQKLGDADAVVIRPGTDGFNIVLKVIYSGEDLINDTVTEFDVSIAVLAA